MNQIIQEFLQCLSNQFHSQTLQDIKMNGLAPFTINQTYFGCEIIIGTSPFYQKMITHQSKLMLEPILNEIYLKYSNLFLLLKNENEMKNEEAKRQFISSLFTIDKIIQSNNDNSNKTKITLYTTSQPVNLQLFLFKQNEPIMDFELIDQLVHLITSQSIDPFIFINNQFQSSCSLSPIGAIIIECDEINQNEIVTVFQQTFQQLIQPVSLNSTLIEKVSLSLNAIIQSSSNESFRLECNELLNNNPLISLRSLISGCCYDNHFQNQPQTQSNQNVIVIDD